MFDIGITAFFIIIVIVLLIIGPERISWILVALWEQIRDEIQDDMPDHPTDPNRYTR